MSFNSLSFIALFPIFTLGYYLITDKYRKYILLLFNTFFCMMVSVRGTFVLFILILCSYLLLDPIKKIGKSHQSNKYHTEFFSLIISLLGIGILLLTKSYIIKMFQGVSIWVPMGISFFLLEIVAYLIEVYRQNIETICKFEDYCIAVSFFVLIQSGPIERLERILEQIDKPKFFQYEKVRDGFLLILWGYFEKILVADLAGELVNPVFAGYSQYSGKMIILATVLFGVQLYADFDGYSNIARGCAKVWDISVLQNFKQPYFSKDIKEFWRRWHISLSLWLKDYIYIPLGGNRRGKKNINLMITFLISGIWHGSGLNYVVWGVLHGFYQIVEELFRKPMPRNTNKLLDVSKIVFNFILVNFAWLFFRANSLTDACRMLGMIVMNWNNMQLGFLEEIENVLPEVQRMYLIIGSVCLFVIDYMREKQIEIKARFFNLPFTCRWFVYISVLILLGFASVSALYFETANFIYGQF